MEKEKFLLKEHSIHADYENIYSEKCINLKIILENAILSGNLEVVKNVVKEAENAQYLKLIFDEDLNIQRLYIAATITSFVEISIKKGLPQNIGESSKRVYYKKIAYAKDKNELISYYFQIVEELINATNKYSIQQYSKLVKMTIDYIHNNKFKPIYVKNISEALFVNRSYLSRRFKNEVGITLTNYIQKTKMDMATELIDSNLYKLIEVSELLGYSNHAYFCKVFKQHFSLSPREYCQRKA